MTEFLKDIKKAFIRAQTPRILQKMTKRRFINFAKAYIARKYDVFFGEMRPVTLFIETVQGCNFDCIMCIAGKVEKKFMKTENVEKISQIFEDAFFVFPYITGEFLLHKNYEEILKILNRKNFYVGLISNFSLPISENIELDHISASVDSANPEKFSKIRRKGNFSNVIKNIKRYVEIQKKNYKLPPLSFNTTLMKENQDEIEDIIKLGLSLGVRTFYFQTVFKKDFIDISLPSENIRHKISEMKRKFKNKAKIFFVSYYDWAEGDYFTGFCQWAFSTLCIDVNGNSFPCYILISEKEKSFGNIFLEYEKVMKRRKEFIRNFKKERPKICEGCPLYFRKTKKS